MSNPTTSTTPEVPCSFTEFLVSLGQTAAVCLGDGQSTTGDPTSDIKLANHTIQLLGVLKTKTNGNLTPEEGKLLDALLSDLTEKYQAKTATGV